MHTDRIKLSRTEQMLFSTPKVVIVATIIIFLVFAYFASKIQKDNSFRNILPPDDPALFMNDYLKEKFDISDKIVIAIVSPKGIYNPSSLRKIYEITRQLEVIDEIEDVKSIFTVPAQKLECFLYRIAGPRMLIAPIRLRLWFLGKIQVDIRHRNTARI